MSGFLRDLSYLGLGSIVQNVFAFILQILLAKNLAVDQFGMVSFFNGVVSIYALVGTAGISAFLPAFSKRRALAGEPPPHAMLCWAGIIAGLFAAGNLAVYWSGGYRGFRVDLHGLYPWVSAIMLPACLSASIQSVFIGYGKTRMVFHANLIQESARLLMTLVLLKLDCMTVPNLAMGWALIYVAGLAGNAILYLRWVRVFRNPFSEKIRWSADNLGAMSFLIPATATMLLPRLIVFLTGIFHSSAETARISVALIFMSPFAVLLVPYQTALLSHFQEHRDGSGTGTFLRRAGRDLALIIAVSGAGACLLGWFGIETFFGADLADARAYLFPLALVFALDAPRAVLDVFFISLLPRRLIVGAETVRALGIVAVYGLFSGADAVRLLFAIAALAAAANVFKGIKAAGYLASRDAVAARSAS